MTDNEREKEVDTKEILKKSVKQLKLSDLFSRTGGNMKLVAKDQPKKELVSKRQLTLDKWRIHHNNPVVVDVENRIYMNMVLKVI